MIQKWGRKKTVRFSLQKSTIKDRQGSKDIKIKDVGIKEKHFASNQLEEK